MEAELHIIDSFITTKSENPIDCLVILNCPLLEHNFGCFVLLSLMLLVLSVLSHYWHLQVPYLQPSQTASHRDCSEEPYWNAARAFKWAPSRITKVWYHRLYPMFHAALKLCRWPYPTKPELAEFRFLSSINHLPALYHPSLSIGQLSSFHNAALMKWPLPWLTQRGSLDCLAWCVQSHTDQSQSKKFDRWIDNYHHLRKTQLIGTRFVHFKSNGKPAQPNIWGIQNSFKERRCTIPPSRSGQSSLSKS